MRTSFSPRVLLVARPSINWSGVHGLLSEYGFFGIVEGEPAPGGPEIYGWKRSPSDRDGDGLPELMGRLCYGSFGSRQGRVGATAYHANILESGHGSVLEHACWSFVVTGASRGFTHQMVRHRAGVSPSQESQHFIRYTVDDGEPGAQEACVCLTGIPPELHDFVIVSCEQAIKDYGMLRNGISHAMPWLKKKELCERARCLLPNALESRIGLTMNARAIRHFCEVRGNMDNALEVRLVACAMAETMITEAPAIFQDFKIIDGEDGGPTVTSAHKKI